MSSLSHLKYDFVRKSCRHIRLKKYIENEYGNINPSFNIPGNFFNILLLILVIIPNLSYQQKIAIIAIWTVFVSFYVLNKFFENQEK